MGARALRVGHLTIPQKILSLIIAGIEESELFFVFVVLTIVMSGVYGLIRAILNNIFSLHLSLSYPQVYINHRLYTSF